MLTTILVKDYMSASLVTLTPETDVFEAIKQLLENRITGAPVIDDEGNLVGMFSEKNCMKVVLEAAYNQGMGGKVSEFMSHNSEKIDGESSIVDAAEKFLGTEMRSFPVFEDVDLIGIISRTDVLRALSSLR
ncbi:MAG: CBS domain-containing protein [Pseudomonadota bacterium]